MGHIFLCGMSKDLFEIPHKISYPYIERYAFYLNVKIEELCIRFVIVTVLFRFIPILHIVFRIISLGLGQPATLWYMYMGKASI